MAEKLNKLQIRAKVFEIIKSYKSEDDFSEEFSKENILFLHSVEDKEFVLEILLKELVIAEDFELTVVIFLISEFATLELAEEKIWEQLKNPNIADSQKEIYLNLLRALGGKVDIQELMNYMDDFQAVVDTQTQELLETATINPEAQIDFLDFLLSLKDAEQLHLINSLEDDFPGDELANIINPCLRIRMSDKNKEQIIQILGKSKSYLAVKPLRNYIKANENDELKRLALKALNQLQTDGLDIENKDLIDLRENEVCKNSTFYKAFLSQIDGCGNQGLIFSRISNKDKVIMFSTVINVNDGIIDCFGLQDITINEFQKVINRFKDNDLVVPISAELAKYKLQEAENLNSTKGSVIPYEYMCWSIYCCDITPVSTDFNILKNNEIKDFKYEDYTTLYDSAIFDTWFFEYDDNFEVQKLIDFAISLKDEKFATRIEQIENYIEDIYYKVFDLGKLNQYETMLLEAGYVFYLNKDFLRANITAYLAEGIKNGETKFLKDVLRRSILQHLANIVAEDDEPTNQFAFQKNNKPDVSKEEALEYLENLEEKWQRISLYE